MRTWSRVFPLILSVLLATAAALPFATTADTTHEGRYFQVLLRSDHPGYAQLFYDVGNNYTEADSSRQSVTPASGLTPYRFPLPAKTIQKLRFDPLNRSASMTLAQPSIVDARGRPILKLRLSDFVSVQQTSVKRVGDELEVSMPPDAHDPILEVSLASPLSFKMGLAGHVMAALPIWLGVLIVSWILLWVLQALTLQHLQAPIRRLDRHPVLVLAAVAGLAVLLQCHPVVFLGRSFVSPNNGSPFLYESFPTVPGSHDSEVEDTKGSDVAAMFHHSLYFPSIQREALFGHGEWPLWNRYFECGIPNLGQGQSMFGSVLNFIPMFGNGSALSWDIRYVLDRWLYAFGTALGVWLLTRSLRAGAVVGFLAVFVGFFGFRINHMAQFSLEASPWIIVGWLCLRDAASRRQRLLACLLLFAGNWEVLHSGTVKEAYMLIAATNLAGVGFLLFHPSTRGERRTKLISACIAGLFLLAIASPWLVAFYDAMKTSYTVSDEVTIQQADLRHILGLFDDIFYSRLNPREWRFLPSTNAAFLLALLWSVVSLRTIVRRSDYWVLALISVGAASLAFAIIPASWISHVPVLRNIGHLHNTFSCVLVALIPFLGGYGVMGFLDNSRPRIWIYRGAAVALLAALLIAYYYHGTWGFHGSAFVKGYVGSLALAAILLHFAFQFRGRLGPAASTLAVAAGLALLTWRHAQYTHIPFDPYVFNPHPRVDFRAHSDAVAFVSQKRATESPSRVAGLGLNMLTGPNQEYGWEGIYGVEAIRNPNYDGLLAVAGVNKLFWPAPNLVVQFGGTPNGWNEDRFGQLRPIQDMLNVRYYLATHGSAPPDGLTPLAALDLDVYESSTAWPRAYFTNNLTTYAALPGLVAKLRFSNRRGPFAAVAPNVYQDLQAQLGQTSALPRTTTPGRDYRFTSNTTEFVVDAASSGVIVLAESYYPNSFRVVLNGRQVPYFQVNQIFKGVAVATPGTYKVRFEYVPPGFYIAAWLSALAALLGLAACGWLWFGRPPRGPAAIAG